MQEPPRTGVQRLPRWTPLTRTSIKLIPALAVCPTIFGFALPVFADYPIIYQRYAANPTGLEYNGRVYMNCSNDIDNNSNGLYTMHSITCISSAQLKDSGRIKVGFANPAGCLPGNVFSGAFSDYQQRFGLQVFLCLSFTPFGI